MYIKWYIRRARWSSGVDTRFWNETTCGLQCRRPVRDERRITTVNQNHSTIFAVITGRSDGSSTTLWRGVCAPNPLPTPVVHPTDDDDDTVRGSPPFAAGPQFVRRPITKRARVPLVNFFPTIVYCAYARVVGVASLFVSVRACVVLVCCYSK